VPELYRSEIKKAKFIANPGCYPTAAILAVAPLLKKKPIDPTDNHYDAQIGFSERKGNSREEPKRRSWLILRLNKVNVHQHSPEINQELSGGRRQKVSVVFVSAFAALGKGILRRSI